MPQGPIEVADDVYWVGIRLPDDRFQCHTYLIRNGTESVLVDPGSILTVDAVLERVQQVQPLDSIAYLVCHHADPDVAGSLSVLADRLPRPDVQVVSEWRAAALLKHYGHPYRYWLVEEHDWAVPLGGDRRLEFQLTPYLHFPGAMVSYDTATHTLFSADLFGGFVPDNTVLESDDVEYILDAARPFHQHYMPSRELLTAGLTRIQQRWRDIERIAPQHGHVITSAAVNGAFEGLKSIDCGIFTLADADIDLQHLLHISEARTGITEALLTSADPIALVAALNRVLDDAEGNYRCALFIDVPDRGWTMWGWGGSRAALRPPPDHVPCVDIPGSPAAKLCLHAPDEADSDQELLTMLRSLAPTIRPVIDEYLEDHEQARRESDLRRAAFTDPLTGLDNRRALEERVPSGTYALIALDIDHFKAVNDSNGHAAGDSVLSQVAASISDAIRDNDVAYRIGGEEFLVVLPDADSHSARVVAERIRARVGALDLVGLSPTGRITMSAGVIAVTEAETTHFASMSSRADAALYTSKQAGRDRVTVAV